MAIQGLRDTSNFITNQRPENWRESLLLLYPNSAEAAKAPLVALTSLMKSESTDDPVFHWWEKELDDRRLKLAADMTAPAVGTSQALTLDSTYKTAKIAKKGDVLLVMQTGEIVHVNTDPAAAGALTVTRGANGGTPVAVDFDGAGVNPYLLIIGSAFEEGSLAPTGVNYDPNERSNYTQIFRSTLEITRTAAKTRLRTGDAVKEAKRECLEIMSIDMERAFWFGRKYATTLNGKPLRFTAGVLDQINSLAPENIYTAPAEGLDMDTFETKFAALFTYGSSEKIAFGGAAALLALQQLVRKNSTWNISSGEKEFGMSVTRFTSPFGTLVFKDHPLFTQNAGGINTAVAYFGHSNMMVILDASEVRYRYVDDVKYEQKLETNGLDGQKSGYLAECGIELHHAKAHHVWKGLHKGLADTPPA